MKPKKQALIILFALLLIIPLGQALDVNKAELVWGNKTIDYYSENTNIVSNLKLELTTNNINDVTLNITGINNRYPYDSSTKEYEKIELTKDECEQQENEEQYTCLIKNLILRTANEDVEIETKQGTEKIKTNITLQKTTANPEVVSIKTNNCHNDICYIKSGKNEVKLKLKNSDAGFSRAMIGLRAGPDKAPVSKCEEDECQGYINTQCDDGQNLKITTAGYRSATSSRDDAGRKITSEQYDLICDSELPKLNDMHIIDSRDIGITEMSEQFKISANITDSTSPIINMKVLGESLNTENVTGQCSQRDGEFKCVADVKPQVKEKGLYDVQVIFTDIVGHEVQDTIQIELIEVDKEQTPDFWEPQTPTQSINSMAYRNMVLDRQIFLEVPLEGNADLLNVKTSNFKCEPTIENETGLRKHISNVKLMKTDKENNKAFLKVSLRAAGMDPTEDNMYTEFKNLEFECGLEILSKKEGYFYKTPEQKNFTFKIEITDASSLDRYVYETIDQKTEELERDVKKWDDVEKTVNSMAVACRMLLGSDTAQSTLSALHPALIATGVGAPATEALKAAGEGLEAIPGIAEKVKITDMCEFLSCRTNITDVGYGKLNDFFGGDDTLGLDGIAEKTGITKQQMLDPYKSQVAAAMTMCVPAYIYHERVKQGIECAYLNCLSEDMISYGVSAEQCAANRDYSTCLRQAGNALYAIPYTNVYSNLMNDVRDMVTDPAALLGGATTFACTMAVPETGAYSACVILQKGMSIPTHVNRIKSFFDFSQFNQYSDSCAPVLEGQLAQSRSNWETHIQSQSFGRDTEPPSDGITSSTPIGNDNELVCEGNDCRVMDKNKKTIATVRQDDDNDELIIYDGDGKSWKSVNTQKMSKAKQEMIDNAKQNYHKAIGDVDNNLDTEYLGLKDDYKELEDYEDLQEKREDYKNQVDDILLGPDSELGPDYDDKRIAELNDELDEINEQIEDLENNIDINFLKDVQQDTQDRLTEIETARDELNKLNMDDSKDREKAREILEESGYEGELDDATLSELDELLVDEKLSDELLEETNEHYKEYLKTLKEEAPGAYKYAKNAAEARREVAEQVEEYAVKEDATQDLFDGVKDVGFFSRGKSYSELDTEDQEQLSAAIDNIANNDDISEDLRETATDWQKQIDEDDDFDLSARDMKREVNKDLRSDRREIRKQQRKDTMNSLLEEWAAERESIPDVARIREGISGMKGYKDLLGVDIMFRDTALSKAIDAASQPEKLWCDTMASKSPRIPGDGGDGSITTKTASGTKPGAYILARKSARQTPPTDEEPYYNHWIEGGIVPQKDGLKYKVVLYDVHGRKTDYTEKIVKGDAVANKDSPAYFGGIESQHTFTSEEDYQKICIQFETDRLSDYFYSVDLKGKELCQKIIGES